ncbi:MAG TPA: GNAT family N-acetyltransferase [Phnomibacter sp.]|nr:GNAT family N-acetyltransferase [Phnomibacter sp.]
MLRTNALHPDLIALVRELDAYLRVIDGEEFGFYTQFNQLENIHHAVVVYDGEIPVACGALKQYAPGVMEVKRMFTRPAFRGKGMARRVLHELETWAKELGYERCILETGIRQPDAVALYTKAGYTVIPNYGQYEGVENSVCFGKDLPIEK